MAIFGGSVISGVSGVYTYPINQSLRFEDGSSAYLNRTPASAGNRKTWTWSGWVKRGNLGITGAWFEAKLTNTNYLYFGNNLADDKFFLQCYNGSNLFVQTTNQVFRDPSAWYHVVYAVDTTQAVDSNRTKLYVNGSQVELIVYSGSLYPSLNLDTQVNTSSPHLLGIKSTTSNVFYDGYLADVHFIDGQALGPEYFGETDDTWGIWKPKEYSGSYGTNGFYLDFSNGAAIGEDSSGNSNDWTANNLAATDIMLDSPTNNFCTLNPVKQQWSSTRDLREGNLLNYRVNHSSSTGTFNLTGKHYWEVYSLYGNQFLGVIDDAAAQNTTYSYDHSSARGIYNSGSGQYVNGSGLNSPGPIPAYTTPTVIMFAVDIDAGKMWVGQDGVWDGDPAAGTSAFWTSLTAGLAWTPWVHTASTTQTNDAYFNFGQDSSFAGNKTAQNNTDDNGYGDFYYAPPSGFLALCSANLDDPAVVPSEHFNTVLYTGTGTTNAITGVGFQPDFTWIKERSGAGDHGIYDAVRGTTKQLESNTTTAETTEANGLTAFGSDGFTVGSLAQLNTNTDTYAAWNWKANNTSGSSNTDGSITSTVAANPDAGFSIVSYTGNATSGATIGHGLSSAPEMIIVKDRDTARNWPVYHSAIAADAETDYIYLNGTGAAADSSLAWNDTAPTSSVFSVGNSNDVNGSSIDYIAYCFHSVPGYSKFGSYIGNNSTDGTFVYTGFRPAFVMVKATTVTAGWAMFDNKREGYNVDNDVLQAESTAAETTTDYVDLLSNGFKFRSSVGLVNTTGGTVYIYMAFASSPFKYSTAR